MSLFKYKNKILEIDIDAVDVADFCAGTLLCSANAFKPEREERKDWRGVLIPTYASLLDFILEEYGINNNNLQINDCRGGVWDKHLFKEIGTKKSVVRKNFRFSFYFTPWFRNDNSGNFVRCLNIVRTTIKRKKKKVA